MLLVDFRRTFRKTGKMINVTKFQKVESFFVCDSIIHIHILFLKLFSILGYYK